MKSLMRWRDLKKIYDSFNPDVNDIVKIGLFFNHFNRFSWTLKLLRPKLDLYPENEKLWFTYFSTYTFLKYGKYDDFAKVLIDKCLILNKERFCDLIDDSFQLMRIPLFKKTYCEECTVEVESF